MAFSANASAVKFPNTSTSIGNLRDISFALGGTEIDVTDMADSEHKYEVGIPDKQVTIEVLGISALTHGATGSLTVAWNDGSTTSISTAVVTNFDYAGALDGEITTTITFRPM